MRYQLPDDLTGVNIGGEQFNADKKGIVTLPDNGDYAASMAVLGAVAAVEDAPAVKNADPPAKVPIV